MASQKRVLLQFGDHNRCIDVPSATQSSKSEQELLIERVRDVYSDLLPSNCTIFLQVKDEEWEGVFVDYFEGTVPDKSIFRIVTAKPVEVKIQCVDKSLAPVASYCLNAN